MAILLKQTMRERETCLKKINKLMNKFIYLVLLSFLFVCFSIPLKAESKEKINKYIKGLNNFSSSFIQSEITNNSEGLLYKNKSRIKIEYTNPSNIEIIISKNKGMYFNKDLNEVEFFNPKNSIGEILYSIFFDENFLYSSNFIFESSFSIIKRLVIFDNKEYEISLHFENRPIKIRRIKISGSDYNTDLGIYNIKLNEKFDKKFFSMINPLAN